jgi:hypothetical protein
MEQKDKTPTLFKTLGLSDSKAVQFYFAAGLLSIKSHTKGRPAIHVNHEQWRLFYYCL